MKKKIKSLNLDMETIKEYGELSDIDKHYFNVFNNFELTINASDIIKMGFRQSGIKREIIRQECELFKNSLF
jgi:hypothetical protein